MSTAAAATSIHSSSSNANYVAPKVDAKPPSNVGTEMDIKTLLRLCNEPLTLFGEDTLQRKVRLQKHIKLYFASLPQPAVAYLNKVNGIGGPPKRSGNLADGIADAEATEVRVADSFGPAGANVVAFRRKLLDASLQLQKQRIQGLKGLFAQHRAEVAKLPPQPVSEEAAAALLSGKSVSTQLKQQQLHNNAHVNIAVTDSHREAVGRYCDGYSKQLIVSAPGEDNFAMQKVIYSTQTCAAVNPNTVIAAGGGPSSSSSSSSLAGGSEVAVGYTDGRIWLYDSGNGAMTASHDVAVNRLAEKGQNRVNCMSWRPTSILSSASAAVSAGGDANTNATAADVLFVARRQNNVEMWRIERNGGSNSSSGGDAADTDSANAGVDSSSSSAAASSRLVASLDRHVAFVNRIACDPTGSLLVSTSDDMTACLWDVTTAQSTATIDLAAGGSASSSSSSPYFLYQQDGHDITSVNNTVWGIDFHPDGAAFATTDAAGICLLWDARSGLKVAKAGVTHSGRCTAVKWLPTGFHFMTGGDDGIVHMYDTRRLTSSSGGGGSGSGGKPLFSIAAHTDTITSLSCGGGYGYGGAASSSFLLPQWISTCGLDGRVSLWSCDDGSHLRTLEGGPIRRGVGETGRSATSAAGGGMGGCNAYRFALPVVIGGGQTSSAASVGIFVGGRDRFWNVWAPSSSSSATPTTKTFAPVSASGAAASTPAAANVSSSAAADRASDSSDSDDDGLAALRKKPRVETAVAAAAAAPAAAAPAAAAAPKPTAAAAVVAPAAAAAAANNNDDSDSDDDALAGLRKK